MNLPTLNAVNCLSRPQLKARGEPMVNPRLFQSDLPVVVSPQECSCGGGGGADCTCGSSQSAAPVYAVGSIYPRFPSLSVEKEYNQATNGGSSLSFSGVGLAKNLYIARELCWVFQIDSVDTYILRPRSQDELITLVSTVASTGGAGVVSRVVVGTLGSTSPSDACNGLSLPLVLCESIFSISTQQILDAIYNAVQLTGPVSSFDTVVNNILSFMFQMTINNGQTDANRAINFATVRYLGIYQTAYELSQQSTPLKLTAVRATPAPVQGQRKLYDIVFSFQGTGTPIEEWYCRVDVTGDFPYLDKHMTRYYRVS